MERTDNFLEKHTMRPKTDIGFLLRLKPIMYGIDTVAESPRSRIRGKKTKEAT
jgi:hypothetical protein